MIGDQLSKRDDRALHKALESVVLTKFPNQGRRDCPGPQMLRAIATKSVSMRDPAVDHVGHCSPCFSELTALRGAIHRRHVLWTTGSAAAIVLLAVLVSYFGFQRGGAVTPAPAPQSQSQIALLDLRNASPSRTVQPSGSGSNPRPIEIPRGLLALTIQLPVGSEAGSYEVQIRKPSQSADAAGKGQASIEGGITKLTIDIDTSALPAGEYEFEWRLADFDWRSYPILIR